MFMERVEVQKVVSEANTQLVPINPDEAFADSLMIVRQLPIIEERLATIKQYVGAEVEKAKAMDCTEETLAHVKKARADLAKMFKQMEAGRKKIKAAVLAPYETFDGKYKDCVANAFMEADAEYKRKIDETEQGIKNRCEEDLRSFFDELCTAHGVDFITFEQSGVKVSMTAARAKNPKQLKDQLADFVANVGVAYDTIMRMDDAEEIMVEYKRTLNLGQAVAIVQDRHRRIQQEQEAAAAREQMQAKQAESVRRVEHFAPPVVKEQPKMVTATFTVTDTIERLRMLKQFLIANNFKF